MTELPVLGFGARGGYSLPPHIHISIIWNSECQALSDNSNVLDNACQALSEMPSQSGHTFGMLSGGICGALSLDAKVVTTYGNATPLTIVDFTREYLCQGCAHPSHTSPWHCPRPCRVAFNQTLQTTLARSWWTLRMVPAWLIRTPHSMLSYTNSGRHMRMLELSISNMSRIGPVNSNPWLYLPPNDVKCIRYGPPYCISIIIIQWQLYEQYDKSDIACTSSWINAIRIENIM